MLLAERFANLVWRGSPGQADRDMDLSFEGHPGTSPYRTLRRHMRPAGRPVKDAPRPNEADLNDKIGLLDVNWTRRSQREHPCHLLEPQTFPLNVARYKLRQGSTVWRYSPRRV